MARVLLYNFRNEARRKKVKALLFRLAWKGLVKLTAPKQPAA